MGAGWFHRHGEPTVWGVSSTKLSVGKIPCGQEQLEDCSTFLLPDSTVPDKNPRQRIVPLPRSGGFVSSIFEDSGRSRSPDSPARRITSPAQIGSVRRLRHRLTLI